MDGYEVQKRLSWNASQHLSVAALGAQQRKANSQPHFRICASQAQVFLVPGGDVMRPVPLSSQAKSSASRSDVQFVPNEPCDIPGFTYAELVPDNSMRIRRLRFTCTSRHAAASRG
jgi:hypothetical protein